MATVFNSASPDASTDKEVVWKDFLLEGHDKEFWNTSLPYSPVIGDRIDSIPNKPVEGALKVIDVEHNFNGKDGRDYRILVTLRPVRKQGKGR